MPTHVTLTAGDLTAVVGDNSAHGEHAAGYNGLWSLTHRSQGANIFVPTYAGVNLEHILNGQTTKEPDSFFEPRRAAMTLHAIDDRTAELYQPATPLTGVESTTTFRLVEPDGIEFLFRATPTADVFPRGYMAFFWASYIKAPEDKSMYFLGGDADVEQPIARWQQLSTAAHAVGATVCRRGVKPELANDHAIPRALMHSFGPLAWDEPMFYGRCRGMTLLMMFDAADGLRLTHSPTGGGYTPEAQTHNPAWDFQFVVPAPVVGKTYGLRAKLVYRPEMGRGDVMEEWRKFRATP